MRLEWRIRGISTDLPELGGVAWDQEGWFPMPEPVARAALDDALAQAGSGLLDRRERALYRALARALITSLDEV